MEFYDNLVVNALKDVYPEIDLDGNKFFNLYSMFMLHYKRIYGCCRELLARYSQQGEILQ